MNEQARLRRAGRRAAVLIVVIVCIMVASAVLLAIARMAAAGRSLAQTESWRVQAAWLAESGLERAARQLADDPDYAGETWTVPPEEFGGPDGAVVEIELAAVAGPTNQRLVRVRARYPADPQHCARQGQQAVIRLRP